MLRTSLLVLILANLVFYLWSHDDLRALGLSARTVGEPQRLLRQVNADRLVLLRPASAAAPARGPASAPSGAAAAAPASAPPTASAPRARAASSAAAAPSASAAHATPAASAAGATAAAGVASATLAASAAASSRTADATTGKPAAGAKTAAAAAPHSTVCLQLGPYTDATQAVGAALRAAGLHPVARSRALPPQWMVLLGPYADDAALHRKLGALRKLGLSPGSYAPVLDRPRYEPGISLGVFSARAAAEAQLALMRHHGVQHARVVQRNDGVDAQYWVLDGLDAAAAERLHRLGRSVLRQRTPAPCLP